MFRIGFGFDAHRFSDDKSEKKKLVIGGVEIPFHLSLAGHSDADVLTHAICDAILGAMGSGDIGTHFPDSDPKYKGISSLILLKETLRLLDYENFTIVNIDSTIVCEKPKMKPNILEIKQKLASVIGIPENSVGVKATTTDSMGFTGRGEGIAAYAVVLVKGI